MISFAFSLACAPIEDSIYYSERRIPGWYSTGFFLNLITKKRYGDSQLITSAFKHKLQLWNAFNILRDASGILGWLMLSLIDPLIGSASGESSSPVQVITQESEPKSATNKEEVEGGE